MTEKAPVHWFFITPEYPPTVGGVGDYTRLVADQLGQAGQEVTVFAPTREEPPQDKGFLVEPVLQAFGLFGFWRGSRILTSSPKPRRLFLQWVPHGYGFKSMNLLLVVWLWWRVVVRRDQLWIMAHEAFLGFENGIKQRLAACVHRGMVWVLFRLASRGFAGNRLWIQALQVWCPRRVSLEWLPVPSNVTFVNNEDKVRQLRAKFADKDFLVGHFGTYGAQAGQKIINLIDCLFPQKLGCKLLLLGKNGDLFLREVESKRPELKGNILAPGIQSLEEISIGISACDVMVQPYGGGISTRNGSLMAVLSHGIPCVANRGHVTDPEWDEWKIVDLVDEDDFLAMVEKVKGLLNNQILRAERREKILVHYDRYFSLRRSVETFLQDND
jgi:glycosyltransferase involved in cell wall biosynthesis